MIVILIVFMLAGFLVQARLKSKFNAYSKIPIASGLSGKEVAEKMLADYGITSVTVQSVPGKLTDHYNPADKTVNLSPEVYGGRSISAAAVASHECGHAVQHATAYKWLGLRSKMVPAVNISNKVINVLFIAMIFGAFMFESFISIDAIIITLIVAQGAITAFTLVTLPVEYDASNRALAWLRTAHITGQEEHAKAEEALKWAARTYLVAALAAVTTLAYYIMMLLGRD